MSQTREPQLPEEASNSATSAERLTELSADSELRSIVASNPAASADLLARLAGDQDAQVRQAVASNPNTPWKVLEQLAGEFPPEFLHNPVGPLQMLAHPEQIRLGDVFWDGVLREAAIPPLWWSWLLSHPCHALHLHVQHVGETIHPYGVSQEEDERDLLTLVELLTAASAQGASFPAIPADVPALTCEQIVAEHLGWLAYCINDEMRQAVAWNPQTPEDILRTLALDENGWVRRNVVKNPRTPLEVVRRLEQDVDERVQEAVAGNKRTPVEVLRRLAQDESAWVREGVAGNERTPVEVLRTLTQDENWDVQATVARNPQTPVEALRMMALGQDGTWEVQEAVARNPQTPTEVLRAIALQDEGLEVLAAVQEAVASHPQTPIEILQMLAQHEDWQVRAAVASQLRTPIEILRRLAQDEDWQVRATVASQLRAPVEVLRVLAQDEDGWVRRAVASQLRTPVEVLRALAQDGDARVAWVAKLVLRLLDEVEKPLRQEGWWEQLSLLFLRADDDYYWIEGSLIEKQLDRVAKLEAPKYVHQTLVASLAADWDAATIQKAFAVSEPFYPEIFSIRLKDYEQIMAPSMPPIALQKLAASPQWKIRYLVALHGCTPWETRQRLSQDGNRYVRAMARAKLAMLSENA